MPGNRRHIPATVKLLVLEMAARGASRPHIKQLTGVSIRAQSRIRALFKLTGDVEKRPVDCGRRRLLACNDCRFIEGCIARKRGITVPELQLELYMARGMYVSHKTLHRTLKRRGYSFKQLTRPAVERNEQDRVNFRTLISLYYHPQQLVFADESHCNRLTARRTYGWAHTAQRSRRREFFTRGKSYSVLPALSLDGILHVDIREGAFTAQTFNGFVDGLLEKMTPYPGPNSVLIVDNASIHHSEELREKVESRGMRLVYLPAYSPDLNPIEEAFSSIKAYLRANRDFYYRELHSLTDGDTYHMLWQAVYSVTPEKVAGWFRHSGYIN